MTPSVPHTAPPASSLGVQVHGVGGDEARRELNPSSCLPLLADIVFDLPAVPQLLLFLYPRKKPCEEATPKSRLSASANAVFIVLPVSSKDQEARLGEARSPRALIRNSCVSASSAGRQLEHCLKYEDSKIPHRGAKQEKSHSPMYMHR